MLYTEVIFFFHQVNCLVNLESHQNNHNNCMFGYFYQLSLTISDSFLSLLFNTDKDNKSPHLDDQKVAMATY